MTKHVGSLVDEMMAAGWLYVADVKVAGNKRKGVIVNWPVTPWAHEFTRDRTDQGSTSNARQIRQKPFEAIRRNGAGGIDAPRPTGASNVPKRYGDLTGQVFDAVPTDSDPPAAPPTELPVSTRGNGAGRPTDPATSLRGMGENADTASPAVSAPKDPSDGQLTADCGGGLGDLPASAKNGAVASERANRTVLDELLIQNAERLGIPEVLLPRGERASTIKQSDHQTTLRSLSNKPNHRDRSD
jgi:hypothetical protein